MTCLTQNLPPRAKNVLSSGEDFREIVKVACEKELQKRARQDSNLQPSDSKSADHVCKCLQRNDLYLRYKDL